MISGGSHEDVRGSLNYVNDFEFKGIKRFYQIIQRSTSVVRAWQGHKIEHKYFYVSSGAFLVACTEIDNWEAPSESLKASHYTLSSATPAILSVPPGFANGIKALEKNSTLMVFSNLSLEDSTHDRFSFDSSLWLEWQKF